MLRYAFIFVFITLAFPAVVSAIQLEGQIEDPAGTLYAGLMDPGASPKGQFDRLNTSVTWIRAYSGENLLAEVRPEKSGYYRLEVKEPVSHLTLEVSGGGVYLEISGPWDISARVPVDLSRFDLFTLQGHVQNTDGSAVTWEKVSALGHGNRVLAFAYTRPDGHYRLSSNVPVDALATRVDRQQVVAQGPFSEDATVDLKLRADQLFELKGTVTRGKAPLSGILVIARDEGGAAIKSARTNAAGQYTLQTDQEVGSLYVSSPAGNVLEKKGSWSVSSRVDLHFDAASSFVLQGMVTDSSGEPLAHIYMALTGPDLYLDTKTNRTGQYRFDVLQPMEKLQVYFEQDPLVIDGPFEKDRILNIQQRR